MRTVTGLFDNRDQADTAVRSLKDAGISSDDISIVANNADGSYTTDGDNDLSFARAGARDELQIAAAEGYSLLLVPS